jgi:hypothetical protein
MPAIPDHEQGIDAISLCFLVFQLQLSEEQIQLMVGEIPFFSCILVLYAQASEGISDSFCVLYHFFEITMPCLFLVVNFVEDRQPDEPDGNELCRWHVVRSFRGWKHFIY